MRNNGRTCRAELIPVAYSKDTAVRFWPTGDTNFPRDFGPSFGFEGLTGAVVVRCDGGATLRAEVAADWLFLEHGWEVSGFLTRN